MAYKVMIVDDSAGMRKMIHRVLMLSGFETSTCTEADDGMDALEKLQTHPVDVILTDINMPRMTGEELIERMALHPLHSKIPVLVISTDRSDERLQRMMSLGARGYVTKPFSPETLGTALSQIFEEV